MVGGFKSADLIKADFIARPGVTHQFSPGGEVLDIALMERPSFTERQFRGLFENDELQMGPLGLEPIRQGEAGQSGTHDKYVKVVYFLVCHCRICHHMGVTMAKDFGVVKIELSWESVRFLRQ
jgi:hypothetical protein